MELIARNCHATHEIPGHPLCPTCGAMADAVPSVAYVLLTSPFARSHGRRHGPIAGSDVLRMHLILLAELRTTMLRRLLIMVPTDSTKSVIPDYLVVSEEIARLPFRATIERVGNNSLGSYGMYFEAFSRTCHERHDYYVFSEDDYVPLRSHFDASLVRMYVETFGKVGRGLLAGVLQGRPVESTSKYPMHAESSHVMSARTIAHLFSRTYSGYVGWKGSITARSFALLDAEAHVGHRKWGMGYYDRVQLSFGALMRDAAIPMRDWTSAFRTP